MNVLEVKNNNKGSYEITLGNKAYICQVGFNGIIDNNKKIEGDRSTPSGLWGLKNIYYRPDKVNLSKLISNNFFCFKKITKNCGWCNDYKSIDYNNHIKIITNGNLYSHSHEKLWREDDVYDIFIETDFNNEPTIPKKGSAIFIHCSFRDLRPTSGCVALSKQNLIHLVKSITDDTQIKII